MRKWLLKLRTEDGTAREIEFGRKPTDSEIRAEAVDLVPEDGYGHEGAIVRVNVALFELVLNDIVDVEIEPDHKYLIAQATGGAGCGNSPDDHEWTSDDEGGCKENPGVWSTGGTGLMFRAHCSKCGLHQTERVTGSQRNPGDHDTVEYTSGNDISSGCTE